MEQDLPVFTPRETVGELDRYVVGQHKAKRAVAIALRNRWRRQQVAPELRDEVVPKNIILIGPTGVGKTEIARRLAKLAQAPFIKVEASKFTEVGYVGRDVESMVRDLTELAIGMVKVEEAERVQAGAARHAEDRLLDLLIAAQSAAPTAVYTVGPEGAAKPPPEANREALRKQLRKGELDEREVELEQAAGAPFKGLEIFGGAGLDDMMSQIQDAFSKIPGMGGKGAPGMPGMPGMPGAQPPKRKRTKVPEALKQLVAEEADKLVDMERVVQTALDRVQQSGIIFLDEIDKIALSSGRGTTGQGPDVSRGGVQRDLLPIVEGSTVNTKHGPVKTDHILFIAAGAFHETKVSDLIPELQGRFPIRVELEALNRADFLQILTEPKNSLVRQYEALLATEGVTLTFSPEALEAIAEVAFEANTRMENIGARRLHTVLETVIEELSFKAPELRGQTLVVDAALVRQKLGGVLEDEDLSRYIL